MAPFSKPETVLKQAEGLVSVGQTHAALQSLTEMFSSKRFRSTPLASLEPIMHRFIELCVDMRKGRTAKEGLMQYKNIAQNTSVQSIEAVITRFVQLSDAKVREAQEKAEAATQVALDVDDLEASETPESILLGAVSGDQSKDRTDRALVTPWLKFLWESYRTSLETLKNNARLEAIYQQIAQQAFKFCLKHQRKVEFRRLCETLRLHLANVAKYSHQPHSINLSDPEILQHHLDTRFAQLNTSVELELWQEAFRSVEDVHNLLTMAKKAPRPTMMANYYEKLTKIFLMSGNALYHAAAWGRYYAIVTSIGGKSEEELSKLAGQVLVSALAVPVGLQTSDEPEELKGKNARLTALLGLTKMPTRAGLLKDALSRDVLKLSPPSVKELYGILEVTFNPLTLCSSIAPLLQTLSTSEDPSYGSYLSLLHQALLSRLLSHLSQVYSSIKVSNLLSLVAPLRDAGVEGAYDEEQIEAYVMGCARRGELNVRVDHLEGCIVFVDEAFSHVSPAASGSVQPSVAELVHTRLGNVASTLYNSVQIISPEPVPSAEENEEKLKTLVTAIEAEREALQLRRALVARRRELLSELTVRKEKEESSKRAEITRRQREEDDKRQKEEARKKEFERNKAERENIRITEAKKYAQSLMEMGVLKSNDVEKMENIDTEELISMQVQHIEKEKKDLSVKTRVIAKRVDHQVRAYRKEEAPLLAEDYEQQQKVDKDTFEALQKSQKEAAENAHKSDVETKARLSRMLDDYSQRKTAIMARKGEDYAKRIDASQRKIAEEKAKRKKAVLQAREDDRKRLEEQERLQREREQEAKRLEEERLAEEERLRAEEEAAAAAAEEEKRAAEEKAAELRKQREAERNAALEEARLKQQREDEAEARRQARALERKNPPPAAPASAPIRVGGESAWRRAAPTTSTPGTPVRASNGLPRSESPAAGAAPEGKYRPGGFGRGGAAPAAAAAGGGGGWREREAARKGESPARVASPASPAATPAAVVTPPRSETPKADDDGFQTVAPKAAAGGGAWRSSRLRGRGGGGL